MTDEVRARPLAEVRKRQNATQVEVAAAMGISQPRPSPGLGSYRQLRVYAAP